MSQELQPKKLTRGEKNKLRHRRQVEQKELTATCPDCGGQMSWCSCCQMFSQHCCVDWGTCLCR